MGIISLHTMMPCRLVHSAHIAVGVLAMLVVALSSELPAFQESDPHPVDGKTQIFQAGYQAGQQAAKSETDAKLSKAIEAAQQQKKIADAALQQLAEETKQKKIASAKKAVTVKEVATKKTQEAKKAKKAAEVGKKKAEEINQKEEKAKAAADLKTKKLAEAKKAKEKADKAVAAARSKATKKAAAEAKKLADKKLAVEKVKEVSVKKDAKEKKAQAAKAAREAKEEKEKATKAAEKAKKSKKKAQRAALQQLALKRRSRKELRLQKRLVATKNASADSTHLNNTCPELFNPYAKQGTWQLATAFIGGGNSDPGLYPLSPYYDNITCTLKFNRCLESDNHTWVQQIPYYLRDRSGKHINKFKRGVNWSDKLIIAFIDRRTGCAKCPKDSRIQSGVLGAHRLWDPKAAKRTPGLTQGMAYCEPWINRNGRPHVLPAALRWPLRCSPEDAAARISGDDRSPLSCIKLGIAKTPAAILGSRSGGINFYPNCYMWKRVVCFYDKGSSNARCATSKQAKLLFVDTCGTRDKTWIAKGGWKHCVGKKFSGMSLLERKQECVYSCQPPPGGRKGDVCYADGRKGNKGQLYRNWPGQRDWGKKVWLSPGLAPPLQIIAAEASIVKAVADYAGVEAKKTTAQYISHIGLCASAAGNY